MPTAQLTREQASRAVRACCVDRREARPGSIDEYGRFRPLGGVLHWHTWQTASTGYLKTASFYKADLERIIGALRALIGGTTALEPNRAHAVDIAVAIARALERNHGDD